MQGEGGIEDLRDVCEGRDGSASEEGESLGSDVRDAGELVLCEDEVLAGLVADRLLLHEIEDVGDGLEGVIDLMRDTRRHPAGECELIGLLEVLFGEFSLGDIPYYFGRANDLSGEITDRRDGEGDGDLSSVLAAPSGFVVVDAMAGADLVDDMKEIVFSTDAGEPGDGLADHLLGGVTEDALGSPVPTGDDSIEGFTDDGVIGGINDCREMEAGIESHLTGH